MPRRNRNATRRGYRRDPDVWRCVRARRWARYLCCLLRFEGVLWR